MQFHRHQPFTVTTSLADGLDFATCRRCWDTITRPTGRDAAVWVGVDETEQAYAENHLRDQHQQQATAAIRAALKAQGRTPGEPLTPVMPRARIIRAALKAAGLVGYIDTVSTGKSTRVSLRSDLTPEETILAEEGLLRVLRAIWPGTDEHGDPRVWSLTGFSVWISSYRIWDVLPECNHQPSTAWWMGIDPGPDGRIVADLATCWSCGRDIRRVHTVNADNVSNFIGPWVVDTEPRTR